MGKREQQKLVHRQAILEAGERVLGLDLHECVAVDRIAAQSGLAKGTMYNYFCDKAALVEAITQRVEARVVVRIERAMRDLPAAGARVAAAIFAMFKTAAQCPEEAVIFGASHRRRGKPRVIDWRAHPDGDQERRIRSTSRGGCEEGRSDIDPERDFL